MAKTSGSDRGGFPLPALNRNFEQAGCHYQIGLQKIISQSFIFYAFKKNYFIFVKSIFWGGRRQEKMGQTK